MKQEKINMLECNLNTEYAEENKYVNEMISSILKSKPELEDVCIEGVNLINNFSNKKLTYDLSKRFLDNFHNFIFPYIFLFKLCVCDCPAFICSNCNFICC